MASTTFTGPVTSLNGFVGQVFFDNQSLSGAGAVNLTDGLTSLTTTGASQALTLADGTVGQCKTIVHVVDGGSAILTPTTKIGFSTITFAAVGDSVSLVYTSTGWSIVGSRGVTIA